MKSSSIIRGFSPSQISYSYLLHPPLADDTLLAKRTAHPEVPTMKWKNQIFTSSGSSWSDESSLDEHIAAPSSGSASFDVKVQSKMIKPSKEDTCNDDDAIEPDDEEVSESLIDNDDDSSDWESSTTESGQSSVDKNKLFQCADLRSGNASRQSLLTAMMHQSPLLTVHPPKAMGAEGSRSSPAHQRLHTPPNGPSLITSQDDDDLENARYR